ncbi:hypothetical protein [Saccharothrix syringae]|uniref:hypothetical protein n=1 Tax=Saccharothrix syringae TaxID=103733 RepID=UPI00068F8020|nr:hypothetical protein [Saccharothrix syringae]
MAIALGIGALAATGAPLLTASAAPAPSCSNATLRGTYTFSEDGWTVSGTGTTPFAFAGVQTYNGNGTGAGIVSSSFNGVITPATANTATYQVDADCTGTVAYTNSGVTSHFDIYLDPKGDSFTFIETDPGSVSAGVETRVSK